MPFRFHLAMDTLPSGVLQAGAPGPPWLVSSFRFRARLGFPYLPPFSGPRGITPAFGYGAPHPSTRGTLTLLNNALLSAHYGPVRYPLAVPPISRCCGYTASLFSADFATGRGGLLQLLGASLSSCCRYYPAGMFRRIGQTSTFHAAFAPLPRARLPELTFSGPPVRSLSLRPDDSLTIPRMALSMVSRDLVSCLPTIQATGL
jgi:hypothetical protein